MVSPNNIGKRLIVCLDGTWMDSDSGYTKPGWFSPGTLQVPSNVTRISRCFKRRCADGKLQIISYESGVGTGSNTLDVFTGGAFGLGLSERMREAYSFICANYMDGDEIFLVGFSRGAFTARSVASMISKLGLLTREGVENFYNIFTDMQHWMDTNYHDPYPNSPFPDKPKGAGAAKEYRDRLEKMGLTRVTQANGDLIKVKAVCVWDTVGSLGVPNISWLEKLGIRASNNDTYKWHDTSLSSHIEHAFHALALDEDRGPFSPAVWERLPGNKNETDLRQVWFPGNHANCGGGWPDQGMANCTLAWMMDQMASVGIEFDQSSLDRVFQQTLDYYKTLNKQSTWAVNPIFENNRPVRPWGLGEICKDWKFVYWVAGSTARTPGMYKGTDPKTEKEKAKFLQDTNERIHSSARIRQACKGLGLNDAKVWDNPALKQWRLTRTTNKYEDPVPRHPAWEPEGGDQIFIEDPNESNKGRWIWEYSGKESDANPDQKQRIMVEEPLGPYERYLLSLSGGEPNVYLYADAMN